MENPCEKCIVGTTYNLSMIDYDKKKDIKKMENPCEKCIVSVTCRKYMSSCQDYWDYNLWKFRQQILINKIIEENLKERCKNELKKGDLNEICICS